MGARRKSTAIKLLTGNPGRRPIDEAADPAAPLSAAVPLELVTAPAAAAEWRRTIAPAAEAGHLAATARALAILHCQLWARVAAVAAGGALTTEHGRAIALLLRVDAEMGFTPASRSKVGPAVGAKLRKNNPLARYLE